MKGTQWLEDIGKKLPKRPRGKTTRDGVRDGDATNNFDKDYPNMQGMDEIALMLNPGRKQGGGAGADLDDTINDRVRGGFDRTRGMDLDDTLNKDALGKLPVAKKINF